MRIPSFMVAAASSGSGKTVISCGLMSAFKQRGLKVSACKCGPDYIDPMFHQEVLGVESENLDLFFCQPKVCNSLFQEHTKGADITVVEGVMGFYDGMALDSDCASSFDVARTLQTPVVLVVPCKGMALSVLAVIQGIVGFRKDNQIRGILLNRVSLMTYPKMKQMIENGLQDAGYQIPVLGYVPENPVFGLESRHLGLITPQEIDCIKERLTEAGKMLSETVELDRLLELASTYAPEIPEATESVKQGNAIRIAIAKDEAFCFYYKDNLEFLKKRGCVLVEFSPLKDACLPKDVQGVIFGGGYPELYTEQLENNESMRNSVKQAIQVGLPCLAECGGFMYLHEEMEDKEGNVRQMAGVIKGKSVYARRLVRFGYIEVEALTDGVFLKKGEKVKGHEFHYWDSTDNGTDCVAVKPDKKRSWECMHMKENLFAGYPHIHFYSNPVFASRFVEVCNERRGM